MRKLKAEDYTCGACYQRVKDCVCTFASPKDVQALEASDEEAFLIKNTIDAAKAKIEAKEASIAGLIAKWNSEKSDDEFDDDYCKGISKGVENCADELTKALEVTG